MRARPNNRLKYFVSFIAGLAVLLLLAAVSAKPFVLVFAREQIQKTFEADKIDIKSCDVNIFRQVSFHDVNVKKTGAYNFKAGRITIEFTLWSLLGRRIGALSLQDVAFNTLKGTPFSIDQGNLRINEEGPPGTLFIQKLRYDKLQVQNIRASTRKSGEEITLEALSGQVLNGMIEGGVTFKIAKDSVYLAKLNFINLDLTEFVQKFDLKKTVEMSGRLSGMVALNGRGTKIEILKGNLGSSSDGGTLTIKNKNFLETLAKNNEQPLDIVVDSLTDYNYNTANMLLRLDREDLILDMAFDGKTGKRHITVVQHDFLKSQ